MLEQLLDDHNQLRKTSASLRALLRTDRMPTGRDLATSRWTLTRLLLRHVAVENKVMGSDRHDLLEQRYRRHIAKWTVDRIDAEWPEYRRDLADILDALEKRMDREERDFYRPRLSGAPGQQ